MRFRLVAHADDVGTLRVPAEGHAAILGASGSGKSRILRRLMGLDEGMDRVVIDGVPETIDRLRELVGWVPQEGGLFGSASVLDNVTVASAEPSDRAAKMRAMNLLDLVGLVVRAHHPVAHLTLSERRRVALARALFRQPRVLVVDGALDPSLDSHLAALVEICVPRCRLLQARVRADHVVERARMVHLVAGGRIVGAGAWNDLLDLDDADVRAAVAWATP